MYAWWTLPPSLCADEVAYKLCSIQYTLECMKHGPGGLKLWSLVMVSVSHFLLVVNCSSNILVYCFMCTKFREEAGKMLKAFSACQRPNLLCFSRKKSHRSCRLQGFHPHRTNGNNLASVYNLSPASTHSSGSSYTNPRS